MPRKKLSGGRYRKHLATGKDPVPKVGVSTPFIWHSPARKECVICTSMWQHQENMTHTFRNIRNRGWSDVTAFGKLLASFLPFFTIFSLSAGKPAHLACKACHQVFKLEKQALPCRMSAAHVSGRLKGRWYCLINHLNMPGVINACCILHNIWDSTGETLGAGSEHFWMLWNDKDRDGVTIWSKKQSEMPSSHLLWGKGNWWCRNALQRVFFLLGLIRFWQHKNCMVFTRLKGQREGEREEGNVCLSGGLVG